MAEKLRKTALLTGTGVILAIVTPAAGQDSLGGIGFTYGLRSEFRMNDNLGLSDPSPGVSTIWDNRLTLGFLSETPVSQLRFNTGGTFRGAALPGQSLNATFDDPFAELGYTVEGANSRFEAEANWRRVDLTFADPLLLMQDGALEGSDLIVDVGSRTNTGTRAMFEAGLNDPFGYGIELGYDRQTYAGTTDPDLYDSRTLSASAFTRFQFTPVAEGRLTASWQEYDADDDAQTNRRTLGLVAGLDYAFDPLTTINANLGYTWIKDSNNARTIVGQGVIGSIGITRDMALGAAGLEFESGFGLTERRSTLRANGTIEMPTGTLQASLGATLGPSGNFHAVGSLDLEYELPRGTITGSLSHNVSTNSSFGDVATTGAALAYRMEINQVSALAFEANFASVADLGATPVDRTALGSLRASYSYELTPQLDLSAGYEYRIRAETGSTRRSSNEIFLVLEHTFD